MAETIDKLKAVLDIERRIADWWRELPYPLATIYRRYQVSTDPKEQLETLLHFFEMAAVYLATIGASHVRVMRQDWQNVFGKWLHPAGIAGIERATSDSGSSSQAPLSRIQAALAAIRTCAPQR